jgi:hypothetical protein
VAGTQIVPARAASWSGWSEVEPAGLNYATNANATTNVAQAAVSFNNPRYNNQLYLFRTGSGNGFANEVLYTVNNGDPSTGNGWSQWTPLPGLSTDATVSPVVFQNQLWVFARELDTPTSKGSIKFIQGQFNAYTHTVSWGNWSALPFSASVLDVAPTAVVFLGNLYLFVVGTDNNIWYALNNGTDSDPYYHGWISRGWWWTPNDTGPGGGHISTNLALAAAVYHDATGEAALYLFAVDQQTHALFVNYYYLCAYGLHWSAWYQFDTQGRSTYAMSASVMADTLYVSDVGSDGKPYYGTMHQGEQYWSGFTVVPTNGPTGAGPALVTFYGSYGTRLCLFIQGGGDGRVYINSYN